ncbi:hypothetical protein G7Y79_00018g045800 [Physcia stellaris]|nr:hypothetical protein G7Y79_00018g045800 [Physcia stellaris]
MEVALSHKRKYTSQSTSEAPDRPHDASIANSFRECLNVFEDLVVKLQLEPVRSGGGSYDIWKDELGRFKIWATNIGAHQIGPSSLDFRLRDASHIRDEVLTLIEDLQRTLQDVEDVLNDPTPSEDDVAPGPARTDGAPETELQQLHRSTVAIIRCLLQLTMVIRNPAQHSLLTETQPPDIAAFKPFDVDHVRNKYPAASEILVHRLGLALTRRRKLLRYRERHHAKLSRGIELGRSSETGENASLLSSTLATNFQDFNAAHDPDSSTSQASGTSFASSLWTPGSTTIPEPPDNAIGGQPFQCPYCYYIITIENTREWRKHIFTDILPYVCTEIDCATPHRAYRSKRDWVNHQTRVHSKQQETHYLVSQRESISPSCSVGSGFECPLCRNKFGLEKAWEDHVAQHLQELALFVLPRADDDCKSDDSADEYDGRSIQNAPSEIEDDQANVTSDIPEDLHGETFINGKGIHKDVIEAEIPWYLGPEVHSRPVNYKVALSCYRQCR